MLNDYLKIVDSQESLDIQDAHPDPTFGNNDSMAEKEDEDYIEKMSNMPGFTAEFQHMKQLQSLRYPKNPTLGSEYSFNPNKKSPVSLNPMELTESKTVSKYMTGNLNSSVATQQLVLPSTIVRMIKQDDDHVYEGQVKSER